MYIYNVLYIFNFIILNLSLLANIYRVGKCKKVNSKNENIVTNLKKHHLILFLGLKSKKKCCNAMVLETTKYDSNLAPIIILSILEIFFISILVNLCLYFSLEQRLSTHIIFLNVSLDLFFVGANVGILLCSNLCKTQIWLWKLKSQILYVYCIVS